MHNRKTHQRPESYIYREKTPFCRFYKHRSGGKKKFFFILKYNASPCHILHSPAYCLCIVNVRFNHTVFFHHVSTLTSIFNLHTIWLQSKIMFILRKMEISSLETINNESIQSCICTAISLHCDVVYPSMAFRVTHIYPCYYLSLWKPALKNALGKHELVENAMCLILILVCCIWEAEK